MMIRLKHAGVVPQKHILDNDASTVMKTIIRDEYKIKMELVSPGCHCHNAAEVAIRNFKTHFLSVLVGIAEGFPSYLWDQLLPQSEVTVNLLRQSNTVPHVSAYVYLSGPLYYNKMTLAPIGCEVQVHENTGKRSTWAYNSVDGWYLAHRQSTTAHIFSTSKQPTVRGLLTNLSLATRI